jgi:preprotein translocase subunit SecD
MNGQNQGQTMSLKVRLSEMLHKKLVALTGLEQKFRGRDFSEARHALRTADHVLHNGFVPARDAVVVQRNLDDADKRMVAIALAGITVTSDATQPKKVLVSERKITGRFVDPTNPLVPVADVSKPVEGMTTEMRKMADQQKRFGRVVETRGVSITGTRKRKASQPRDQKKKVATK